LRNIEKRLDTYRNEEKETCLQPFKTTTKNIILAFGILKEISFQEEISKVFNA
jgi:hypothetical protein